MFYFLFFCSGEIWSGAETRKGTYIGCNAAKHTKSWTSKSSGHWIGWSTTIISICITRPYGNMWIYTWKSGINETTGTWMSILFNANNGEFYFIFFSFYFIEIIHYTIPSNVVFGGMSWIMSIAIVRYKSIIYIFLFCICSFVYVYRTD